MAKRKRITEAETDGHKQPELEEDVSGHERSKRRKKGEKRASTRATQAKTAGRKNNSVPLLRLPPELRNELFRNVLLEDRVVVNATHHETPGLLRTWHQLRDEASSIFYQENKFLVEFVDLKPSAPPHHWTMVKWSSRDMAFTCLGHMNWANLKTWLKRYHESRGAYPGLSENGDDEVDYMSRAFDVVQAMFAVAWDTVDTVLEHYRNGIQREAITWT
ncbi:hypothetical protein LTR85_008919 [Meristemomyces frigidus]|nr:hypothetical protein LTR85_008919 [Meristemomyces frigidus]